MRARLVQRPKREGIDERATAPPLACAPDSVGSCRLRLWWRPRRGGDHGYQRGVYHHDDGPRADNDNDNDPRTDNDTDTDNDNDPRTDNDTDTDDYSGSCDDDLPSNQD